MPREPKDVTEAEMSLLQVLWERGRSSTRQLADVLHPGGAGAAQYATLQKQLERLEAKGFVSRDRTLFVHTFTASVNRNELIGRQLREVARKLCGGSLGPLLTHLMRDSGLTSRERSELRRLIDADEPPRPGRKRKG